MQKPGLQCEFKQQKCKNYLLFNSSLLPHQEQKYKQCLGLGL